MYEWELNQTNTITFVLVDAAGTEVTGLGNTFTLEVRKVGGAFVAGAGTKSEISDGWYQYIATAAEADTSGPVSIIASGAGTVQQNLEYVVRARNSSAVAFTYTVNNSATLLPIEGVEVWITTDLAGTNVVWNGVTDALGVARDVNDNLPWLDPGTYYFWKQGVGMSDDDNPDTEVVG